MSRAAERRCAFGAIYNVLHKYGIMKPELANLVAKIEEKAGMSEPQVYDVAQLLDSAIRARNDIIKVAADRVERLC